MDETIEVIYSRDGKRRVVIFKNEVGTFGYKEQHSFKNDAAEGWAPLGRGTSFSDTVETARREVAFNVLWLAAQHHEA